MLLYIIIALITNVKPREWSTQNIVSYQKYYYITMLRNAPYRTVQFMGRVILMAMTSKIYSLIVLRKNVETKNSYKSWPEKIDPIIVWSSKTSFSTAC